MTSPTRPTRPQLPARGVRPNSAEARAAKFANRPPIPQAVFIAPPAVDDSRDERNDRDRGRVPSNASKSAALRTTKAAAEAARRFKLNDEQLREILENASQVGPDRDNPDRTRFTRGQFVVVTGKDGVILGVYKR